MFDCPVVEGDGPVRRIAADRCRDMEAAWQLGIYTDLRGFVKSFSKLLLDAFLGVAVSENVVLDALRALVSLADRLG